MKMYHKTKKRSSCTPNNVERYHRKDTEYRHFDNDTYLETMVSKICAEKLFKGKSETTTFLKPPPPLRIVAEYESRSESDEEHQATAEIGVTATSKDLNNFFLGSPDKSGDQGKERSNKKVKIASKQINTKRNILRKEKQSPTPSKQMNTEKKTTNIQIKPAIRRFRHKGSIKYDDQNERNKKEKSFGNVHGCPEGTYYSVPRLPYKSVSPQTTALRSNRSSNVASCTPLPPKCASGNSPVISQRVSHQSSGRSSMKSTNLKTILPPAPQTITSRINNYRSPPMKSTVASAPQAKRATDTRLHSKVMSANEVQSQRIPNKDVKSAIKHSSKI